MERIARPLTRLTGQRLGRTGKRVWEVRGPRLFLAQAALQSFSFAARCAVSAIRPCKVALPVLPTTFFLSSSVPEMNTRTLAADAPIHTSVPFIQAMLGNQILLK